MTHDAPDDVAGSAPETLPKAWEEPNTKPAYANLSDPRMREAVLTFERPRGLMRRGHDLAYLAGKTRFVMLMSIACVMIIVGVAMAIGGFTGADSFLVPVILTTLSLAVLLDVVLFVRLWAKERRFTRELSEHIATNQARLDRGEDVEVHSWQD